MNPRTVLFRLFPLILILSIFPRKFVSRKDWNKKMGSFLSRTLLYVNDIHLSCLFRHHFLSNALCVCLCFLRLAFGYAYPAYECFKAVENNNNPEIHQLRFWCQYWVLVAILTVCEKIGDVFISWYDLVFVVTTVDGLRLPLYSEVKLAFVVYLWYPKWKGTIYVYNCFLRPYVAKHETEIDRNLFELKMKAREVWFVYWHEAVKYGHARFHQMLLCFSSRDPYVPCLDQQHENLREASSKTSLTKPKQLEQQHLPVSSSLSVSEDDPDSDYLPTNSTPSVGNGIGNSNPCLKGTKTKRRAIWRVFKRTKPHKII
ncbi:hypothetical protein GQ457_04G000300 [Hibiscus cannabinus]